MCAPFNFQRSIRAAVVGVNRVYIETNKILQVVRVVESREGKPTTLKWLSQRITQSFFSRSL